MQKWENGVFSVLNTNRWKRWGQLQSPSASDLCSCSCHQKKLFFSSLSDHVTCFSCDQYLIILILLAARTCLLSYLSAHGDMPALSFLLAVYFLQSVSVWRHLDVDQCRCRDGEARASDPTRYLPWPWLEVREPIMRCHTSFWSLAFETSHLSSFLKKKKKTCTS